MARAAYAEVGPRAHMGSRAAYMGSRVAYLEAEPSAHTDSRAAYLEVGPRDHLGSRAAYMGSRAPYSQVEPSAHTGSRAAYLEVGPRAHMGSRAAYLIRSGRSLSIKCPVVSHSKLIRGFSHQGRTHVSPGSRKGVSGSEHQ